MNNYHINWLESQKNTINLSKNKSKDKIAFKVIEKTKF